MAERGHGDRREQLARELGERLATEVPAVLLDLWVGEAELPAGCDMYFLGPDEIVGTNEDYETARYRPDLLLIGTDGGGRGLFVVKGQPDLETFLIETGAIADDDGIRLGPLEQVRAGGFLLPEEDERDDPRGDILLTRRPDAGVPAIAEIRKRLRVTLPPGELVGRHITYPVVLLAGVRLVRYLTAVETLNRRYGCLEVR